MKTEKTAKRQYSLYVDLTENAQTDVREIVKRAFFTKENKTLTEKKLKTLISNVTSKITIETLKTDTARSLLNYANQQRKEWQRIGLSPETLLFLGKQTGTKVPRLPETKTVLKELPKAKTYENAFNRGVPLGKYYNEVWREKVKPALDNISQSRALDPNDYTGRNSLRNLAEMEVRYNDHLESIEALKKSSVKLVVCSSHADCSERCAKWQGRIYSLDHTYGKINGHYYVPLEEATDVWYTTKAGRRYKNGLLGFNCRHYLKEYTGELLPTVSEKERKKQYEITERQRTLERAARKWEAEANTQKGITSSGYKAARAKAEQAYDEYLKFCKDNKRAAYPIRAKAS